MNRDDKGRRTGGLDVRLTQVLRRVEGPPSVSWERADDHVIKGLIWSAPVRLLGLVILRWLGLLV